MTRLLFPAAALLLGLAIGWRLGFGAGTDLSSPSAPIVREVAPPECADLAAATIEVIDASSMYPPLIPRAIVAETSEDLGRIVKQMRKATSRLERVTPLLVVAAEGCSTGGTNG